MASLKQYEDKIKTLNDFEKVVNIEKIVVMREIAELKKIIDQLKFKNILFNNLMIDLNKKHAVLDKGYFSVEKNKVPIKRDLWFIMTSENMSSLGSYSNKLIIEHLKGNADKKDLFVVVGSDVAKSLEGEGYEVLNKMSRADAKTHKIYNSIAGQVINGYQDLMFKSAKFVFFDLSSRRVNEIKLFPFQSKKRRLEDKMKVFTIESDILEAIKINKSVWLRDLNQVSIRIAQIAIKEKSYHIVTEYKLDSKLRELQSLDDKEKNIQQERDAIKIKMARVRQESVTNELLTNAVAFGAINESEGNDE